MDGKRIVGGILVVLMGVFIFMMLGVINGTIDDIDLKCKTCGSECKIEACSGNTMLVAKMIKYVLSGIYFISAIGILYFSFRKSGDEKKVTDDYNTKGDEPAQGETGASDGKEDEYAYG